MATSRLFCAAALLLAPAAAVHAAPVISTLTPAAGTTVSSLTNVSVTFSEPVTGVEIADLVINGEYPATVTLLAAPPNTWQFSFSQPSPGTVSLAWESDHGIAGIGTGEFATPPSWTYTLTDSIAPGVEKIRTTVSGQEMEAVSPTPNSTVAVLTEASVLFSELVTGVDASDLLVNGSAAAAVTGEGAGPYTFTFPQPPDGAVTFQFSLTHEIKDSASNVFSGGTWTVTKAASAGTLTITEFLAANAGKTVAAGSDPDGARDEDFDLSPWIEITNTGTASVNLTGWSLTNEYEPADGVNPARWSNPQQWIFRGGTLSAGGRLVVWASGKDRKPAAGHQHTNFSLDTSGGSLAIFAPDSPRSAPVSSYIQYPAQRYDYSYGKQSTDGEVRYFSPPTILQTAYNLPTSANPTPAPPGVPFGSANNTSAITGTTPNPTASVARGFFNEPFQVHLSSQNGAAIRYTLNGVVPTVASPLYSGPLAVNATTVLRFAAFGTNMVPSETVTHSYLFLDNVVNQPGPPYDNPANATDNANPQPPNVGGQALPVAWGSNTTGAFPGLITNLSANQVPADYGMDPKVTADPNRYSDAGGLSAAGFTNMERIRRGLRELPMLSIVIKIEDMFGDGPQGVNSPSAGLYATTSESDKTDRTKPCSLELLSPDGTTEFAVTCGIDLHGNASRAPYKNPKHGFTLRFKGKYGTGKLDANLFPDSPVHDWDKLILRADFNSSWRHQNGSAGIAAGTDNYQRPREIRCRDAWCKDAFRDMGHAAGHHRYTNLFINGVYWGTYDLAEDQGEDFAAAYFGGEKADYDVIDQGTLKSGTWVAYSAMKQLLGWTGGSATTDRTIVPAAATFNTPFTNAQYEQLKQYLDVPWFIDYMALHWFTGHRDWATTTDYNKNWYVIRRKNGKFKFLPWDQENLLWHESEDRVTGMTNYAAGGSPTLYPPAAIHPRIKSNAEYRLDCADRLHRLLIAPGGALTPAANIGRLDKWAAIMNANAMCLESARWGDYRYKVHAYTLGTFTETYSWNGTWFESGASRYNAGVSAATLGTYSAAMSNNWRAEINRLRTIYFPARTNNLLASLRNNGLYPALNAPEFRNNTDSALTGDQRVPAGYQLKMQLPAPAPAGTVSAGTIYYTINGPDPRVAYDTTGQRTLAAIAYAGPVTIDATATVKARALNGSSWSALMQATFSVGGTLPAVVISEINYNPRNTQGGTSAEFIEFFNYGATDVDLSGWSLEGADFVFPNGLILGARNRLVLANNNAPAVFAAQYPDVLVAGYFGGALDNNGERLSLYDAAGRRVCSVEYDDAQPWPAAADNGGYSLELINAAGDPQAASNWTASTALKGSPGAANDPQVSQVVISEFFAAGGGGYQTYEDPGHPLPDFVELLNAGAEPANVAGWTLNGEALPATTIASGTRLVFRPASPFDPVQGQLILRNATGVSVDGLRYGPQITTNSFYRNGGTWVLGKPTPGAADLPVFVQDIWALKINEFLADPVPGEDDWVEFYDTDTDDPINLTGFTLEVNGSLFRIAAPAAIQGDAALRFFCDAGGTRGDNINLQLPAGGGTITLRDTAWRVADSVTYGPQQTGVSQGRLPNATGAVMALTHPSPGNDNLEMPAVRPLINEVMVINEDGDNSPWARRPAWIELKNPLDVPENISQWSLRTISSSPQTWSVPIGVSIPAAGYLVIWCDPLQPASTAPGPHLNAALPLDDSYQHWGLELISGDGQVQDSVTWGQQIPDRSIGRISDGTWALLAAPTRSQPNSGAATLAPAPGVMLNEWLGATAAMLPLTSFIEIYNPAPLPVGLGGLWLGDEPSETGRRKWQIPALTFVAGQQHSLFTTGTATSEPDRFLFDLASGGEYVRLSQNDAAVTAVDAFSFGAPAATGISQGRLPDGSATTGPMKPTPGAPNSDAPGPVIVEHPSSRAVRAGETTTFVAAASDYVSLQWLKNGQPVPESDSIILTLSDVTAADDAEYTFTASNALGTTASRPARLTVLYNYAAWAAEKGIGAITADNDNDGLTNGDEFLSGGNPLVSDTPAERSARGIAGGSETIAGTTYLTLEHTVSRRAAFSELIFERSDNLSLWNPAVPSASETVSTQPNGDYRVKVKFPWLPGDDREFLRLKLVP